MHNRDVTLRQIAEDDLPFLFRLFVDPERAHLWMCGRTVHDERGFHEAWISWSTGMMAAKFLVEAAGRPIGLVFDYDRAVVDGFTKVTALMEEDSVGGGRGVIATSLFVDWLFQNLPLRKVYSESYGYNRSVVRILRKAGLVEEGVLKGTRFWNGSYWDVHIFAVDRGHWPDIRRRFLRTPIVAWPGPERNEAPAMHTTGAVGVHASACVRDAEPGQDDTLKRELQRPGHPESPTDREKKASRTLEASGTLAALSAGNGERR